MAIVAAVVLSISAVGAFAVPADAAAPVLVKVVHQAQFGNIFATPKQKAIYYWSQEKDHKVHCTGSCAMAWPPVLVAKGVAVPAHVMGAMGMFGTIVRPDHTRQLTFNGWPLYTYSGDKKPLQVLCDGVDGWHVYRAH